MTLFYEEKPHDLQFMYEMIAEILSDKLMPVFRWSPQHWSSIYQWATSHATCASALWHQRRHRWAERGSRGRYDTRPVGCSTDDGLYWLLWLWLWATHCNHLLSGGRAVREKPSCRGGATSCSPLLYDWKPSDTSCRGSSGPPCLHTPSHAIIYRHVPIYIANITIHNIGMFWRIAISRYLLNYWRSIFTIL